MGLLDPVLAFLLGPPEQPAADPMMAAAGVVRRRYAHLERARRGDLMRLVYLASMLHVGRHGTTIFPDVFEATTMGPSVPRMMDDLRRHVPRCLNPVHDRALPQSALECLDEVCDLFADMGFGATVAATHREGGAWAARYRPYGDVDRGPVIRTEDMAMEYRNLVAHREAA